MQTQHTPALYDAFSATYDKAHARWLHFAGGQAQCAFEGAATALLEPGMSVLDAACGTGTVARRLSKTMPEGIDLVLLDASEGMLGHCTDIAAKRVHGRIENLPFGTNSFDLVMCAWGVETLHNPNAALAEFLRVTRQGGRICIVFCADRPAQTLMGGVFRWYITRTGRGAFLDHLSLRSQAEAAGAKNVRVLHCSGPASAMIIEV
jgi:ubiquinone/menaquinone biosynthesis C-methylase UbiE